MRLRPRDMAKIGQLVLAGGRWNDRQIVSKAWIETSTAPKIKATDNQSYGYLWWLGRAGSMGVRSTGLARSVEAGNRSASSRSSISSSR